MEKTFNIIKRTKLQFVKSKQLSAFEIIGISFRERWGPLVLIGSSSSSKVMFFFLYLNIALTLAFIDKMLMIWPAVLIYVVQIKH